MPSNFAKLRLLEIAQETARRQAEEQRRAEVQRAPFTAQALGNYLADRETVQVRNNTLAQLDARRTEYVREKYPWLNMNAASSHDIIRDLSVDDDMLRGLETERRGLMESAGANMARDRMRAFEQSNPGVKRSAITAQGMEDYLQDKRTEQVRSNTLAELDTKRNEYVREKYPWLNMNAASSYDILNDLSAGDDMLRGMEEERRGLKESAGANAARDRARAFEKSTDDAGSVAERLFALLDTEKKTAVNPYDDAGLYREEAGILRQASGSANAHAAGMQSDLANELERRAGIIEDPKKALEEVNADIEFLNSMLTAAGGFFETPAEKKKLQQALDAAERQRELLLGMDVDVAKAGEKRNLEMFAGEGPRHQTDESVLAQMNPEQKRVLTPYMANMAEGVEIKDHDAETIDKTVMMTRDELEHYRNLQAVNPEQAARWLDAMSFETNKRKADVDAQVYEAFAERAPVTANVLGIVSTVADPIASAIVTGKQLAGIEVDHNAPEFALSRLRTGVDTTTKGLIDERVKSPFWNKVIKGADTIGDAVLGNVARMLTSRAMGLGGNASTAMMAYGTYADNVGSALEKGATQGQAALLGVLQSGAEFITEKIPTGQLMDMMDNVESKTIGKVVRDVWSAIAGDGLGEMANSLIATTAETAILRDKSDIAKTADTYMYYGVAKDAEEATWMAWRDKFTDALYEGVVGAVSAGMLSGGIDLTTSAMGKVQESRRARLEKIAQEQAAREQAEEAERAQQEQEAMDNIAQGLRPELAPELPGKVTVQTAEEMKNAPAAAQSADDKIEQEAKTARVQENRRQDAPRAVIADEGYVLQKNGESVNVEDADDTDADVRMLHFAPGMSESAANDMLETYEAQEDVSADEYAKGYKAAYDAGLQGKAYEYAERLHGEALTEAQRKSAWAYGRQAMTEENTRVERLTRQNASKVRFAARTGKEYKGVSFEHVTREVSGKEETSLRLLDAFAKRFGLQVQVYDTLDTGRSNASYVGGTNVVKVALDATDNALLRAASHEMYHYVENFSQEDAKAIRQFVLDKLRAAEDYDLDTRIQEVTARYTEAGVQNFDAESEIVAESMLDIIGTEENVRALAQQSPTLLNRIKDAVARIRAFLREQIEKLAGHSDEANALMNDEAYMQEIVQRMNAALENATKNREAAQRAGQTARQDSAVQTYLKDVETAADAQERANLLESLTHTVYARTQGNMLGQTGDYDGGYKAFRETLKDFANGQGNLGALLTERKLDAAKNEQDNAVMAYVARELVQSEGENVRKSAKEPELITPKTVLWTKRLNKTSPTWRKGGKDISVLTAASKDGLIRTIAYTPENVNPEKKSLKDTDTMDFFSEMSSDEYVRDAGKLISRLEEMRKKTAFTTGAWQGSTVELSKKLLEETHSTMNQGALTRRINAMYKAMDAGDMSANQLMEYAYDIAQKVAEGAGQVQELGEGEKEARDYIRNTRVYLNGDMQSEVKARYGSIRAYMNRNFGRARFTTNSKATGLEDMWPELNRMAPGYFPMETDVSAMPEVLEVFLDATGKVNRDYFGASEDQLRQDVAIRLFWEYYRLPGTYADQETQKQKMVQELSDLQDSMRNSFDQRVEEKVQRILKREQREKDMAAIRRKRMMLAKRYNIPTRDKHIPEQLRGAVKMLLDITEHGGGEDGKEYAELAGELRRLRSEDPETMINISTDLDGILDQMQEAAKGKTPGHMTPDETEGLRMVTDGIHHACTVADKILTEGQKGSVREIALKMHEASGKRADRKVLGNKRAALKGIKYNLMDAPRYFRELQRYMGDGAKDLWKIVRHGGFDKMARNLDEAAQLMESKIGQYDYGTWTGEKAKVHEVQVNGEKIRMTTGQIMSLYMLNQREQARSHLYGADGTGEDGGIIAGRVAAKGGTVEGTRPHTVTPEQVDAICSVLTKEQMACANALGEIMSTWCAEKGNETSRGLYGYDMYKEKHYFPIEVWGGRKNVTQEEQNATNMYQLMNKGWTKNLVKNAQAPIMINDIFDVVGKHINEVIMYNSWALPVRDVLQVMNYKGKELMTFDMEQKQILPFSEELMTPNDSVRADIERVMGKDAFNYLTQMIKDINGMVINKVEKGYASASGKMLRNFKATAVGFNLGTVVKQPTSVMRAFEVIPAHYFAGSKTQHDGKVVDLIKQYAPVMTWKQFGYFTMDTGKSTQSALFPKTENWQSKVSDISMWGAGKADEITWVQIWKAAERMTKSRHGELTVGSDAFYRKTAEYFNQCIDETQTVDSVLHRSELMRQKTEWVKAITTFMGEPLKTMNMLIDSYNNLRAGNTAEARRKMAKSAVYFASAAVVTSFVNSLVSALRNWDDEDPFWEQVMGRWLGEYEEDMTAAEKAGELLLNSDLLNELNVLNKIPIAKDLMEMLRGYDINRMDMDTLSAVMDAAQGMFNEKLTRGRNTLNLLGAVGNAFGIPANNVIKEARNMWNITMRAAENAGVNTLPMQYALIRFEKDMNQKNMTDYAQFIVKAEAQGKTEYAEEVRKDMLGAGLDEEKLATAEADYQISGATGMRRQDVTYEKTYAALGEAIRAQDKDLQTQLRNALHKKGKTDEDIAEGLKKYLTEDERVIAAAQKAIAGDESAKMSVYKTLRAEGFDDEIVKKAVNSVYNRLYKEKYKTPEEEVKEKEQTYEPVWGYNDLHVAVEEGDAQGVRDVLEELRKAGKSDSSIKSALTSRIKPVYVALATGSAADRAKAKQIKQMLLQISFKNKYTEEAIDDWLKK